MRLRKVKNAEEIIENSKYIVKEPKEHIGKWENLFNNENNIYIEIGMGKGNFIIENALTFPNINFIGIERFDSVIVRAIEKLNEIEIDNLKLIKMDAMEIEEIFDKEIDLIYLNFSDPWPKERHHKRRLTSHIFLKKYDKIFKANKKIIMKTDNRDLFDYSVESLKEYGYEITYLTYNLHDEDRFNIETEYEAKKKINGPIYLLEAERL